MKNGGLLAFSLAVATVVLIVIGCVWPVQAARPFIHRTDRADLLFNS